MLRSRTVSTSSRFAATTSSGSSWWVVCSLPVAMAYLAFGTTWAWSSRSTRVIASKLEAVFSGGVSDRGARTETLRPVGRREATMTSRNGWQRQPRLAAQEGLPKRVLLAMIVVMMIPAVNAPGVGAQAGTPRATPEVAAPDECTVAPRSEDELRALFREAAATPLSTSPEASPTPAVAPMGLPADEQTVAEVTATWRQYIACLSAGDQARMFALSSDAMVRRQFVIDIAFGVTEDALFTFLAATPVPLPADQPDPFVPFEDVRVLSDGRVAVVGPGEQNRGDVRVFVREGDRWLIDDWFDLS